MFFRVLGAFEVISEDGQDLTPSAPKLRRVLALLILNHNKVVQTSSLVDELWGERPPHSSLTTLQTYVYQLRKILPYGNGSASELLLTKPFAYQAAVSPEQIDVHQFHKLVAEGGAALDAGDALRASEMLNAALALWRGPALAGIQLGRLLESHANQLEESRLQALELRMRADLMLGRHQELISELKSLTQLHPMYEEFQAKLMLALYRSGRRIEALDVFRELRQFLVDEQGLEPSTSLQQLHQAVLNADKELDYVPVSRRPAVEAAPVAVTVPAQLPADLADFTGREGVLAELKCRLSHADADNPVVRLITVTGMAGVGKTACVVRAAHQVRSLYPDGQFFVDLRGRGPEPADPADVVSNILTAVGVPAAEQPAGLEERAKLFRTWCSERKVLLVLDDAASDAQILPLLPGGPGCAVLITSRSRLHGPAGARRIELDAMSTAEGVHLLSAIMGADRTAADPEAAADTVRRCDHLPLALRIVGSRLNAMPYRSLRRLADDLADERRRLANLQFGDVGVRDTFEAILRTLRPGERAALHRVAAAGNRAMNVEEASRLLGTDVRATESVLDRLVEERLMRAEQSGIGAIRYRLPDLVRIVVREGLDRHQEREGAGRSRAGEDTAEGALSLIRVG